MEIHLHSVPIELMPNFVLLLAVQHKTLTRRWSFTVALHCWLAWCKCFQTFYDVSYKCWRQWCWL